MQPGHDGSDWDALDLSDILVSKALDVGVVHDPLQVLGQHVYCVSDLCRVFGQPRINIDLSRMPVIRIPFPTTNVIRQGLRRAALAASIGIDPSVAHYLN